MKLWKFPKIGLRQCSLVLQVVLKRRRAVQSENFEQIIEAVRQLQLDDRGVFDRANRAFVSYIQAYSKHECNLILRVKGKFAFCFQEVLLRNLLDLILVSVTQISIFVSWLTDSGC